MDLLLLVLGAASALVAIFFAFAAWQNRSDHSTSPSLFDVGSFTPIGRTYVRRFWIAFAVSAIAMAIGMRIAGAFSR